MTPQPPARPPYPLLALFAALTTVAAALAWHVHTGQKEAVSREVKNQVVAIADFKVKQIDEWRQSKLGEARILLSNQMLLPLIERLVRGVGPASERAVVEQSLETLCSELHYAGATLTGPDGKVVLSRGRTFGGSAHLAALGSKVVSLDVPELTELRTDGSAPAHLGLNIPLRRQAGEPPFGVLLLGLDPEDYLYPLLRRWPTASATGESLLVRRDGDQVLFLTALRKPPRIANLRLPLTMSSVAAARAINGEEGAIEAVDYSGAPVYAAVRPVPGTPWRLVAKVDVEEVLAPLRWRSWLTGALAVAVIFIAAGGVFALWRHYELRWYRVGYETEFQRREAAERHEAERRAMTEDLRRAFDTAQQNESRFRIAFEQAAVGMNEVSLEGRYLRVNQRFSAITGYSVEELLTKTTYELTHADDRTADQGHIAEVLREAAPHRQWRKRYVRKDGTIVWVDITASLARGASGAPEYMLGVVEDVTAAVQAEESIRQSHKRFQDVVENAPEGIVVVSDGVIRYANPAAARIFEAASPAALVDTPALDRVVEEDREGATVRIALAVGGTRVAAQERKYVRLSGDIFFVEASASPILYDGRPSALVFFRDLTERKRAEEERDRLEQRYRQAQKMESVGRLAGGVAHDFNNHLTVINGYCDMLLDELAADDPLREEIDEIRAAGDRAAGLTQQLLAFSRKQIVEPRPLSLNEVVDDYCRMVRRLIGDDIEVCTRLEPELGTVLADPGQIHQVLMNLAINARDAMANGGTITLSTANLIVEEGEEAPPGPYVELAVADTGAGMTQETIQKIFEPFFTTKPMGVGTGLGLSTVYGIVQQAGGFIRVESEVGRGSCFHICLPRIKGQAQSAASEIVSSAALRGTETVLVAEDQAEVRKLATGVLKRLGYRLLEAADGQEALRIATSCPDPIHLLLTDVVMPGMNGRQLAEAVLTSRPSVRVMFMSGYTDDAIERGGIANGSLVFLRKPFSAAELAAKVREALAPARDRS